MVEQPSNTITSLRQGPTNINVQYNAGLDSHMTFSDGSPIVTGFTLSFTETEIITQDDGGNLSDAYLL